MDALRKNIYVVSVKDFFSLAPECKISFYSNINFTIFVTSPISQYTLGFPYNASLFEEVIKLHEDEAVRPVTLKSSLYVTSSRLDERP